MTSVAVRPRSAAVRFQRDGRPVPSTLPAGSEWWEDYQGALRNRVVAAVRRGEVEVLSRQRPIELRNQLPVDGILVRRLRPAPPRWRKPLIVAASVLVPLAGVVWAMVYVLAESFAFVADHKGAFIAGAVLFLLAAASIAGPACPGLHCGGCRG